MYRANQGYFLKTIGNETFLLPFGQQIADQKKGISLNETGILLWNLLQKKISFQDLVRKVQEYYHIEEDISSDIQNYLNTLENMGIITHFTQSEDYIQTIQIANLYIRFYGEKSLLSSNFDAFKTTSQKVDQNIYIRITPCLNHEIGTVLLRNKEMVIMENEQYYVYLFPTLKNITEAHMTKDGKNVYLYAIHNPTKENIDHIFHAIRAFFLFIAQKNGYFAIHSASILYQDQAWLFSGHSGMGKSTHTKLWHDLYDVPYLNGDLNLVGQEKDTLMVYGIPWCGTSNIYTTQNVKLGGIVLLGRSKENHLEPLSKSLQILRVMQRMISPSWNFNMLEQNIQMATLIQEKTRIYYYLCTKEESACKTMKEIIDEK